MKNSLKLVLLLCLCISANAAWAAQTVSATRAAWVPGTEKLMIINSKQRPLLWDLVMECPFYFHGQNQDEVLSVAVSKNGRLAASSSIDKKIKVWDVATGAEKHEIVGFNQPSSVVGFIHNSRTLLFGDWSGDVRQWDLETFREEARIKAFDSAVLSMDVYHPTRYVATDSSDEGKSESASAISSSHIIALGSADGEMLLWDMQLGRSIQRHKMHNKAISVIKFSESGRYIISAGDDGQLMIWDYIKNKVQKINLESSTERIDSLSVSPDGQYALAVSNTGMVYLVSIFNTELVYQKKLSKTGIQMATFRNNYEALIVDREYRIWSFEVATRKLRAISEVREKLIVPQSMTTKQGQNWVDEKSGIEFTWVEGGCFNMGCNVQGGKSCAIDNMSTKNVCVDDYWIGQNEITAPQWKKVMGKDLPRSKVKIAILDKYVEDEENGVPVASGISWREAQDFVCRLNKLSGGNFRLPTEAEWEYACNNSMETYLRQRDLENKDKAEHDENQQANDPNMTALLNINKMDSGVSEWVLDIYSRFGYKQNKHYNPLFLIDSVYYFDNQNVRRVKRGGGWDTGLGGQECIVREFNSEQVGRDPNTGIRLTAH